jgi:hypothetical protein
VRGLFRPVAHGSRSVDLAGWATVLFPEWKQDDGMAYGSWSRNSRRTLHAGSGTYAAENVRAKNKRPADCSSRALGRGLDGLFLHVARPIKSVNSPRDVGDYATSSVQSQHLDRTISMARPGSRPPPALTCARRTGVVQCAYIGAGSRRTLPWIFSSRRVPTCACRS